MLPYLKSLVYDPASFANFIRAGVFLLGELLGDVVPGSRGYLLGKFCQAGALLIRAGDKQPPAAAQSFFGTTASTSKHPSKEPPA